VSHRVLLAAVLALAPFTAAAQQIQPGKWVSSSKITSLQAENLPPGMAANLAAEPPDTDTRCVTPSEAASGFQKMLQEKDQNCTFTNATFTGGVMDVQRVCKGADGTTTFHMHGPFSPTGFNVNAAGTGPHGFKLTMIFTAKRVGACG
jgi:hypothetical protein